MARAAFVMDRAKHSMGLHGKSFIPMLLGFGCTVPAIYATRTLENPRDKAMTALLVPLMSCCARLPVYVLFIAAFFPGGSGTPTVSVLVWFLLNLPWGVKEKKDSFLGKVRQAIAPVFKPQGFGDWAAASSLEAPEGAPPTVTEDVRAIGTSLSAYAFMAYMPCVIAAVAFKHEFGTWKWYGVAFGYQSALAWTVALVIYQGGRLLGLGG